MTNYNDLVAVYFKKTKKIIHNKFPNKKVVLQFFQRKDNMIAAGLNEVINILKKNTDTSKYNLFAVNDGEVINNGQPILKLEGDYTEFAEYEGIIDGILARRISVASNSKHIIDVANGKNIICMSDRGDDPVNQARDAECMVLGGINTFVTEAQAKANNSVPVGTIPHSLIALHDGDLISALESYKEIIKEDKLVALVDYNNDVIGDSIKVANHFNEKLSAVRVDTSQNILDKSLEDKPENYGTCPNLIKLLRSKLDEAGHKHVKIIVSSGFNVEKIKLFEKENTPVDTYGVGGYLMKIITNVSADIVLVDGKKQAKYGRENNLKYKLNKHF